MAKRIPVKNILRSLTMTKNARSRVTFRPVAEARRAAEAALLEQHMATLMPRSPIKPEDFN